MCIRDSASPTWPRAAGPACIYTGPPRPKTGWPSAFILGICPHLQRHSWVPWVLSDTKAYRITTDKLAPSQNRGPASSMQKPDAVCIQGSDCQSGRSHQVDCWYPTGCLSRRSTSTPATGHNLLHTFVSPASRAETSSPRNQ